MNISKKMFLYLIILSFIFLTTHVVFKNTYKYDNKYTISAKRPVKGIITLEDSDTGDFKLIPLIEDWEFYRGRLLWPEDFNSGKEHEPEYISLGQNTDFLKHSTSNFQYGEATYRLIIKNTGKEKQLNLEVPEFFSAGRIFVNEELIAELGIPEKENYQPFLKNTIVSFIATDSTQVIIQISNYSHFFGGLYCVPVLGSYQAIYNMLFVRFVFYGFIFIFTLEMFIFSTTLWLNIKKNKLFFYYGHLCIFFLLQISYPFVYWRGIKIVPLMFSLELTGVSGIMFCVLLITGILSGVEKTRLFKIMRWICIIFCLGALVLPMFVLSHVPQFIGIVDAAIRIHTYVYFIYIIYISIRGVLKDYRAFWLFTANGIYGFGVLLDFFMDRRFEPAWLGWGTEYYGFMMILIFSILIITEIFRMKKENKKLTDNLEEEIRLRTKELIVLSNERKRFLSTICHDLKAPISAIKTYMELIRTGNVNIDDELSQYLDVISKKSDEMQYRVGVLQDFSMHDLLEEPEVCIEVGQFLTEVYKNYVPDAEACGVLLKLQLPDGKGYINVQRDKLIHVFENIILNAASFSPQGGEILIKAEYNSSTVILTVADSGIGIANEDLPHIFDRYFSRRRVEGREEEKGTRGLGLFFVKAAIIEMRGTVDVQSEKNNGTTFKIELPLVNKKEEEKNQINGLDRYG